MQRYLVQNPGPLRPRLLDPVHRSPHRPLRLPLQHPHEALLHRILHLHPLPDEVPLPTNLGSRSRHLPTRIPPRPLRPPLPRPHLRLDTNRDALGLLHLPRGRRHPSSAVHAPEDRRGRDHHHSLPRSVGDVQRAVSAELDLPVLLGGYRRSHRRRRRTRSDRALHRLLLHLLHQSSAWTEVRAPRLNRPLPPTSPSSSLRPIPFLPLPNPSSTTQPNPTQQQTRTISIVSPLIHPQTHNSKHASSGGRGGTSTATRIVQALGSIPPPICK